MEIRRATFGAAFRLAIVLSTIAAAVALGLESIGEVSRPAIVLTVIVVGFVTSWVETGRAARSSIEARRHHRVAVVHVRHPVS
jgi:hypothetical protein